VKKENICGTQPRPNKFSLLLCLVFIAAADIAAVISGVTALFLLFGVPFRLQIYPDPIQADESIFLPK
jgi:hypothetical protein